MLIHVFRTPSGFYLYDAWINLIVPISEKTYQFILNNNNSYISISLPKEIAKLKKNGFFQEVKSKYFQHILTDHVHDLLSRSLSGLRFQVTQNCNLRCHYCPYTKNNGNQRLHSNKVMSLDTAMKTLNFFHQRSIDTPHIKIGFTGGEPLLEFDLIKKIITRADQLFEGKPISYQITTNATLLTKDILEFLTLKNVQLMISLDGPKKINDKQRIFANNRGTYDTIIKSIMFIKDNFPEIFSSLIINMVLDPANDFESIALLLKDCPALINVAISAFPIMDFYLSKNKHNKTYSEQYSYYEFLEYLSMQKRFSGRFKSILSFATEHERKTMFHKLDQHDVLPTSPRGPCVPGLATLFVNTDGIFLPCESVSEICKAVQIGDINNGFNKTNIESLLNLAQLTKKQCSECWAYRLCNSCAMFAVDGNKLSATKRLEFCTAAKEHAQNYLLKFVMYQDLDKHAQLMGGIVDE